MVDNKQHHIISRDKDILGGTPVFKGTRVPVKTLWEYLKAGDTLDEFLEDFPSVKKDQAVLLIDSAQKSLMKTT
jgi:uncharacterized protein (DUF433 family)